MRRRVQGGCATLAPTNGRAHVSALTLLRFFVFWCTVSSMAIMFAPSPTHTIHDREGRSSNRVRAWQGKPYRNERTIAASTARRSPDHCVGECVLNILWRAARQALSARHAFNTVTICICTILLHDHPRRLVISHGLFCC